MNETQPLDELINWGQLRERPVGFMIPDTNIEVVKNAELECDHDTCYETHDVQLVIRVGKQYFLKEFAYSSYDGWEVKYGMMEVFPKVVSTTTFEVNP